MGQTCFVPFHSPLQSLEKELKKAKTEEDQERIVESFFEKSEENNIPVFKVSKKYTDIKG